MRFISLLICATLVSCSALSGNRAPDKEKAIETKDVSYNAREENEAPRHRLLILPFLDERPDQTKTMTDVARQTVVRELLKTRQFVVVSPEDFPHDPKKFLTDENEYDLPQIAKLASTLGVAAVV